MLTFFVGILLIFIGGFIIVKSEWFLTNFGRIQWAEAKMHSSGGSRLMYKLIGMAFVFIGLLCITGLAQGFIAFVTSPLTRIMR